MLRAGGYPTGIIQFRGGTCGELHTYLSKKVLQKNPGLPATSNEYVKYDLSRGVFAQNDAILGEYSSYFGEKHWNNPSFTEVTKQLSLFFLVW